MIVGILLTITPSSPDRHDGARSAHRHGAAYIFGILATVYIAAATRVRKPKPIPVQSVEA